MLLTIVVAYAVLANAFSAPLDVTVARTVGGGGTSQTLANAISVLSSGSIVLSGYTTGNVEGTRVGVTEGIMRGFSSDGSVLWTNQESTGAGGNLQFVSSTIDSSDNIYALARCSGSFYGVATAGGDDVCVVKYDGGGNPQASILAGGTSTEQAWKIAVNKADGTIYIVGGTSSTSLNGQTKTGFTDAFLLKYSISGSTSTLLGTHLFGVASQSTFFHAVTIDSVGNVWAAGFTTAATYRGSNNAGSTIAQDFVIQKMSPSGTVLFSTLIGGPGMDMAYGVTTDPSNNAYVCGYTTSTFDGIALVGGARDLVVVKYNSAGVKQWSKTFGGSGDDGATAVTFDTINKVLLVTGYTFSASVFGLTNPSPQAAFLLVLDPSTGNKLSARLYTGTAAVSGAAVAIHGATSIYLAGVTYGSFQGQSVSGAASAYMLKVERYASAPYDVSYLALGLNPGNSASWGNDVAMFSNGDLVLGGVTDGYLEAPSDNLQLMVQRYSASGNVLWTAEAGGTGSEGLSRVAVDNSDNTYVVGSTTSAPALGMDVFYAKFNSTGATLFNHQYGGSGDDYATAVAVDSTGSFFYVVGNTYSSVLYGYTRIGDADGFVTKINTATGAIVRHRPFGCTPYCSTNFQAAAIDSTGNLWVTGTQGGAAYYGVSPIGSMDVLLQKFDSVTGSSAFVTLVGGAGDDDSKALSIDVNDNLYVAAISGSTTVDGQTASGAGSSSSILVVKWNSAGTKLWTKMFGGAGSDEAYGSAVDSNRGLLYLTGQTDSATFHGATNTNSAANPFLLVLNTVSGSVVYAAIYSSTSNSQGRGLVTNGVSTYMVGTAVSNLLGQQVNPFMSTFLLKLVGNLPGPTAVPSRAPTFISTRAPTGPSRAPTARPTGPYEMSPIVGANPYNSYSAVYGVAGFSNGDVLMAGITTGYVTSPASNNYYFQFLFQRFTPSGTLLWSVEAGGNKDEYLTGVAVDVNNVAYASGLTYSASVGGSDISYAKITQTSGTTPVATHYRYGGTGNDSAAAVVVDSTGSFFYLVGQTNSPTLQGQTRIGVVDGFVTKINAVTGAIVWHRQYGCATCTTTFSAAALDSAGNLWVCGTVQGGIYFTKASIGGQDLILHKFATSTGDSTFINRTGGTGDDVGTSIAIDSSNNVYVGGNSNSATVNGKASPGAGTGINMLFIKWNSAGAKQWTQLHGGVGDDTVAGITLNPSRGELTVGGNSNSPTMLKIDYHGVPIGIVLTVSIGLGVFLFAEVTAAEAIVALTPIPQIVAIATLGELVLVLSVMLAMKETTGVKTYQAPFHVVSVKPSVAIPVTVAPSFLPTLAPPTRLPSRQPSRQPTSQPSSSPTNHCGAGWTHYGNKCYKTGLPSMTFDACRAYCPSQRPGAGMLCIENAGQNTFISTQITAVTWMGYTDELTEGAYLWGPGCSSTYTNWIVGQPDNYNNRQHYAIIYPSNGVWDDIAGSYPCSCEYVISTTCSRRLEEEEEEITEEEQQEILSAAALAAVPAIPVAANTPKLRGYSLIKSLFGAA